MAEFFPTPDPSGSAQHPSEAVNLPPPSDSRSDDTQPAEAFGHQGPRRPKSRCRRLAKKDETTESPLTAEQRLLLLDTWRRSGLPAGDFAPLVGISKHTLYAWKHKFETEGPAGLA